MDQNFDYLFSDDVETVNAMAGNKEKYDNSEFWFSLQPPKEEGKSASCIVRLIPMLGNNPKTTLIAEIQRYKIPEPNDPTQYFWYHSPKTLDNSRATRCEVLETWFESCKQGEAGKKRYKSFFDRRTRKFCALQIVGHSDASLIGKIYKMDIPDHISGLVESITRPSADQMALGETAHNPFNLIKGRGLYLTVYTKDLGGKKGRGWERTKWHDKDYGTLIPKSIVPEGSFVPYAAAPDFMMVDSNSPKEFQTLVIEHIKAEMSKPGAAFDYIPPTPELLAKVKTICDAFRNDTSVATGGESGAPEIPAAPALPATVTFAPTTDQASNDNADAGETVGDEADSVIDDILNG